MAKTVWLSHQDTDNDGISDCVVVYNDGFGSEPLFGDYRGIELCRAKYISCREDSVVRAIKIAMSVVFAEVADGSMFDDKRGLPFIPPYSFQRVETDEENED